MVLSDDDADGSRCLVSLNVEMYGREDAVCRC